MAWKEKVSISKKSSKQNIKIANEEHHSIFYTHSLTHFYLGGSKQMSKISIFLI